MNVIAINGSPRKNKNTATLLIKALEGAKSQGAKTELVHLYDLNYKGCNSCFACKLKEGKSYGKCAFRDELAPVLEKIEQADAVILGSPVYYGSVSGQMHTFLERLMFPYTTYTEGYQTIFDRKIYIGFIYTMNVTADQLETRGYHHEWRTKENILERIFGHFESIHAYDTYQFDDYSKYVVTVFDKDKKAKVKEEQFPKDCDKAYDMGCRFSVI